MDDSTPNPPRDPSEPNDSTGEHARSESAGKPADENARDKADAAPAAKLALQIEVKDPAAAAPREKRQAIIYLPGLRRDPGVESIEAVAHRIALAKDNLDPNATYSAATGETAIFAGDRARKASVLRKGADGRDAGVLDVYEFDYRGPLVDGFGKRSPLYQGLQVFATMAGNTRNFLLAIKRPGQSVPQKLQVLYGGMLMSGMLLYILLLLLTATATAKDGIVQITGADSAKARADSATAAANRARDSLKQLQVQVGQLAAQRDTGAVNAAASSSANAASTSAAMAAAAQTQATTSAAPARLASAGRPAPRGAEMRAGSGEKVRPVTRADVWLSKVGGALGSFLGPALDFVSFVGEILWTLVAGIAGAIWSRAVRLWEWTDSQTQVLQAGVATITVLGLAFRFNLKETLARTAGTTACISNYVAYGVGRPEIVGQLARLLEHLRADEKVEYTAVHVVGYSFGSVVAIDCIYQDSEVSPAFEAVTSLTTIGCPADFIRTYWRDYFVDRHGLPSRPRWHNVHAPADVLASNFRDGPLFGGLKAHKEGGVYGESDARGVLLESETDHDPSRPAAATGQTHIVPSHYSHFGPRAPEGFFGWMLFILAGGGFKAHACYWPAGLTNAKTCWELVMERLDEFARIGKFPPPPPAAEPKLEPFVPAATLTPAG